MLLLESQNRDLRRIFHRKRAQQKSVYHAEDRGVRADAEGQGDDRDNQKARIFQQHAGAIANVLQQCFHFQLHDS